MATKKDAYQGDFASGRNIVDKGHYNLTLKKQRWKPCKVISVRANKRNKVAKVEPCYNE